MHTAIREQELIHLTRERSKALVEKDVAKMQRLLADTFRYVNAGGRLLDKTAYLEAYVTSDEARWSVQELDELGVEVYGETALVTCRVHDVATFGSEPLDATFRSAFVWVQQEGTWRCTYGQTTALP